MAEQWEKMRTWTLSLSVNYIGNGAACAPHRSNGEINGFCSHHLRYLRMIFTFLHQFSIIFSICFSGDEIEYKLQTMIAFAVDVFINFFSARFSICLWFFALSWISEWKKIYLHMNWRRIIQKHATPCTFNIEWGKQLCKQPDEYIAS